MSIDKKELIKKLRSSLKAIEKAVENDRNKVLHPSQHGKERDSGFPNRPANLKILLDGDEFKANLKYVIPNYSLIRGEIQNFSGLEERDIESLDWLISYLNFRNWVREKIDEEESSIEKSASTGGNSIIKSYKACANALITKEIKNSLRFQNRETMRVWIEVILEGLEKVDAKLSRSRGSEENKSEEDLDFFDENLK